MCHRKNKQCIKYDRREPESAPVCLYGLGQLLNQYLFAVDDVDALCGILYLAAHKVEDAFNCSVVAVVDNLVDTGVNVESELLSS